MAAAAPVLGLRPTRARLARTCHVPKRRRITESPCCKLALIVVRMASTAASALAVVHPSSWAIRCTISAFLIVRDSVCVVDVRRVWHPPSPPVDVAGARLAWPASSPHGHPAGGKLSIGQGALSRGAHTVGGVSSPTLPAHACAARGGTAA